MDEIKQLALSKPVKTSKHRGSRAKARRKLRRLAQRLLKIDHELDDLIPK